MKRLTISMLLIAVSALADPPKSGKIQIVGRAQIDFGRYDACEKKIARYKIRNGGEGNLKIIKVRKTCGCASATADKKELKPGEEANIEVVILANSIFGNYRKATFVESSDPINRFVRLWVQGNAVPLVAVSPRNELDIGRIALGTASKSTFKLKPTRSGVRLGKPVVKSNYEVATSFTAHTNQQTASYSLELEVRASSTNGDLKCAIELPVLAPTNRSPVRITLTGKIGAGLCAVPAVVRLPLSDKPMVRTFHLKVLGQPSRKLAIEELKRPKVPGVVWNVTTHSDGRSLAVEATFLPEFVKQLHVEETLSLVFVVSNAASATVSCRIKK